ncbi:MAG: lipid-A-disaccharide synthase [Burkholderiales bacterium]|jgi:lipid-A-disaccharide synthase
MKIGIVAGEPSGDAIAASLIRALRSEYPHLEFVGIAGSKMQMAGATSWFDMELLSVRGYVEVLKRFRKILAMRCALKARLLEERVGLFIGVDAPDFNLGLERDLRAAGVKTVHYISPSIWAWRGERIHKIKAAVDHLLTIFPFEGAIFDKAGVASSYVGHPFADEIPAKSQRESARAQLRLKPQQLVISLLPGSRQTELDYHAGLFIETAKLLQQKFPEATFLVPLATRETRAQFDAMKWQLKAQDLPMQILFGHANFALAAADVALVASGTATLEAAMLRCPHVIAYRMSPTTYRMMKKKAYLPYVGLPNILAGEWLVPELLQDDATPQNLAQALANWITHRDAAAQLQSRFAEMHASLAVDNAARVLAALRPFIEAGGAIRSQARSDTTPREDALAA